MTVIHLTRDHALRQGVGVLSEMGVDGAMRDARLLLADVLGIDAGELIATGDHVVRSEAANRYAAALTRRIRGEPVSRIRGWREFYGRRFAITPDVLDPRADTETLVEVALAKLPPGGRVLDLGTGSGCVLVSILAEREAARGVGLDLSEDALGVAQGNAQGHGVADRAEWICGSWDAPAGAFDVVVSNPPYIPAGDIAGLSIEVSRHDPLLALDGGRDGLDAVRDILTAARDQLGPDGWLAMEVGFDQTEAVMELAEKAGWTDISRENDLAGRHRVVIARRG